MLAVSAAAYYRPDMSKTKDTDQPVSIAQWLAAYEAAHARKGKEPGHSSLTELVTIRDWLRHAVSRFRSAGLVHGHGAETALDEAAFIILEALSLPVDDLGPWLEARLTVEERARISALIDARITTRKPAAYLMGVTYLLGRRFRVDERAIVPRSFIAELLFSGSFGARDGTPGTLVDDPHAVQTVLDLCTGSGCLAILAAEAFPNAQIDAADLSAEALALAHLNLVDHMATDQIRLIQSDLFAGLKGRHYDLILTNPPYVTADAVAAFPPEYAAEPVMAHLGGADGLALVHRILAEAGQHLTPHGGLLCEVGSGRAALEAARPDLPFLWLDAEGTNGHGTGEVFWLSAESLS
jgi:ribosomal protein L3 glutamine methyltransferase